jgi:RecA-family ATPase
MTEDDGFIFGEHPAFEDAPDPSKGKADSRTGQPGANGHDKGGKAQPWKTPDPAAWRERLQLRSAADVEGKEIKAREWDVPEWMPRGHLTGLYGPGSSGKTTLAMQLAAEGSVGGHVLGLPVRKCRPVAVLCEDDEDEIDRRIRLIANGYGRKLSDYREFKYLPRLGEENLLVARVRNGLVTTPLYDDLAQMIADEKRDLVILDGVVEIFGGNMNDPTEVSWFLSKLIALGKPNRASAMLIGHPNKAGSSEFLGCGTWENKPRARWYFARPKLEDGEEHDWNDPRRVLSKSKANLSVRDRLEVVWRDGMFRAADPKLITMDEKCEQSASEFKAREAFLTAIDRLNVAGVTTSPSKNARNYAPRRIVEMHMDGGFTAKQLETAMNQLVGEGRVRVGVAGYNRNRNEKQTLVAVGEP